MTQSIAPQRATVPPLTARARPLFWAAAALLSVAALVVPYLEPSPLAAVMGRILLTVSLCAAASALEHRLTSAVRRSSLVISAAVAGLLVLAGTTIALVGYLVGLGLSSAWLPVAISSVPVSAAGVWLAAASLGTLLAKPLISRRIGWSLRLRVACTVAIGLVLTTLLVAVAPTVLVPSAMRLLHMVREYVGASASSDPILAALGPVAVPDDLFVGGAAVALLFGLPLVLSATTKLVDSFVLQLSELLYVVRAFGKGRTEVRARVGGSSEQHAIAQSLNGLVESLERRQSASRLYGHQSDANTLERLAASSPTVTPATREASVLVAELRGTLEELKGLEPEEASELLEQLMSALAASVTKEIGYLHRLAVDSLVVVFNGPIRHEDHAMRATRCAIEMMTQLAALNRSEQFSSIGKLSLSIGVVTGPVTFATSLCATPRFVFSGPTADLAFSLARVAPHGHVLVNHDNAERLPIYMPSVELAPTTCGRRGQDVSAHRVWPPP